MQMIGQYSEPMKQLMLTGREQKLGEAARTLVPQLQAVYGKPEQLKTLLAGQSPEVLGRPEIPWGSMNEELWRQGERTASGNAGLAGLLWNLPGIAQNVGKGVVNLASRGLMGSQAPQVPYTEFTNPVTEVPRYREAQAVLEALEGTGAERRWSSPGGAGGRLHDRTSGARAAMDVWDRDQGDSARDDSRAGADADAAGRRDVVGRGAGDAAGVLRHAVTAAWNRGAGCRSAFRDARGRGTDAVAIRGRWNAVNIA